MDIQKKIAGLGTKTLAIMAVLVAVAAAATVAWLSIAATTTATVQSPFDVQIIGAETETGTIACTGLSCDLKTVSGGSWFTVTGTLENKANNEITAETRIVCNDGVGNMTCDQLNITHKTCIGAGCEPIYPQEVVCTSSGTIGTDAIATYRITPAGGYEFAAGHQSVDFFNATIVPNFSGHLGCSIQVFPVTN